MSRRSGLKLNSLSTASLGLLALGAPLMLPSSGCGDGVDTLVGDVGTCQSMLDDNNPCTADTCDNGAVTHATLRDATPCVQGKNKGTCQAGVCKLDCDVAAGECACAARNDCPADTDCMQYACSNGKCALTALEGKALPDDKQTQEDCKFFICGADGSPIVQPAKPGADCTQADGTKGVCDAQGSCASCVEGTTTGCPAGEICFSLNGTPSCTNCGNGMQDGDETDVDCGGTCATCLMGGPCKRCDQGKKCGAENDNCNGQPCVDGVCCESTCGQECQTCELGTGLCKSLPTGSADVCAAPKVCAGALGCKLPAGEPCASNSDCMSSSCYGAPKFCDKSTAGEPCADFSDCVSGTICNANKICQ